MAMSEEVEVADLAFCPPKKLLSLVKGVVVEFFLFGHFSSVDAKHVESAWPTSPEAENTELH